MITMKPAQAKNFFFDRVLVTQYMDRKTASALAKGGGLIRRIAQNSMRSRKRASAPGTPPSRHTADDDHTAFHTAFFADSAVEFAIMDGKMVADSGVEASQGLRATCSIFNFSRNEELENAIMTDVSIKPTYATNAPSWLTGTVGA